MWGNQRDAQCLAFFVQRVAIVGFVAEEFIRLVLGQATVDQLLDELGLVRRSTYCA